MGPVSAVVSSEGLHQMIDVLQAEAREVVKTLTPHCRDPRLAKALAFGAITGDFTTRTSAARSN